MRQEVYNMKLKSLCGLLLLSNATYALNLEVKGFLKTDIYHSDQGVGSYGDDYSHVAPTRALRTDQGTTAKQRRDGSEATSFQIAQSRFSFHITHGKAKGVFEFDFIDSDTGFNKQTALQAAGIRTRMAYLDYAINDRFSIFMGQKWGTASGIKGVGSWNYVGNAFQTGNTGFFNQELGFSYKLNNLTFTLALTGKGRNFNGGVNENELGSMPGLALDINYKSKSFMIGLASHAGELEFEKNEDFTGTGENQNAYLAKVYGNVSFWKAKWNLEYYVGQSLNNLNALGVGAATKIDDSGNITKAVRESGVWTSLMVNWNKISKSTFGYGQAAVADSFVSNLGATSISENTLMFANYSRSLTDQLQWYIQWENYTTKYGSDEKEFDANVYISGFRLNI